MPKQTQNQQNKPSHKTSKKAKLNYERDFDSYIRLRKQYAQNALMLYALQLRFDIGDINAEASESLTDGSDDKKCDLIYIDVDNGVAVIAQAYYRTSSTVGLQAPSNKASDLNTAAAWILNTKPEKLPETIRDQVAQLHEAIKEDKIRIIYFWYVHNYDESLNRKVEEELSTVAITAKQALAHNFPETEVHVEAIEVGNNRIESWYNSSNNPISISGDRDVHTIGSGFEIHSDDWKAYVTAVSATWLHNLYNSTTPDLLFSGNPRDYLGYGKKKNKINLGIRESINKEPSSFWAYNNGITALVHDYTITHSDNCDKLQISGITIINGAQTTGTIGSINSEREIEAWIPIRFIVCTNSDIIANIVTNNNRQTEILPSDLRSNDPIQRRLRTEFDKYSGELFYSGGRRASQRPSRSKIILEPDKVAQALYAFHVDCVEAYQRKKNLWEIDKLYNTIFHEDLSAEHIIFTYFLYEAVNTYTLTLKQKGEARTDVENGVFRFLTKGGAKILLIFSMRHFLESILGTQVRKYSSLSFRNNTDTTKLKDLWMEVITAVLPATHIQLEAALDSGSNRGLKSKEKADDAAKTAAANLASIVQFSHSSLPFENFRRAVNHQ